MTIIVAAMWTDVYATARADYPQTMTTTSPFVNLPRPSNDPRWGKAFAHWDKREDTEEVLAGSLSRAGSLSFRVAEMLGFPRGRIIRASVFSTRQEPACLSNHLRLAELYLNLNRRAEAKASPETVINADPATLKFHEPENRMSQKEAQVLYGKHFK